MWAWSEFQAFASRKFEELGRRLEGLLDAFFFHEP